MAAGRPAAAPFRRDDGPAGARGRLRPRPTATRRTGGRSAGRPLTRVERRRAAKARRARLGFVVALVASVAIVAAWFPLSDLTHQRQQLSSATTQLDQLRQEDQALAKEQARLKNPAEIARIAREQYQLVQQGNTPYQVLPQSDSQSSSGTAVPTDPGLTKPVTPSGDVELPPGALGTGTTSSHSAGAAPSSFLGRIAQTLEFWR